MKKQLLIALMIFISAFVNAQKESPKDDTLYYIYGNKQDFALLLKSIYKPGAMTRDEITLLSDWIMNKAMLPQKQEAEKPKEQKPKN